MNNKGVNRISPNYTKKDYRNIHLTSNSAADDWRYAVDIFSDRIEGRFLNQIQMLSTDINSNGFAIMALNCLLIETMYQFENGLEKTPDRKNREKYSQFLLYVFPNDFNIDTAKKFYDAVRCGILHSAQTTKAARLSDSNGQITIYTNGVLEIAVQPFTEILKNYIHDYKKKLLDSNQQVLRQNFCAKMAFICDREN